VNDKDIRERASGRIQRLPVTPGIEAAEGVEAVSDGMRELKAGKRVAYVINRIGASAEEVVVRADRLIPLPDGIDWLTATALSVQGMSAHYLLHGFRKVTAGTTVLIHAAAGGMGLVLVQWAKHLGARVIGTVSSEEKALVAREAGADHLVTTPSRTSWRRSCG
jgi:NADPH2:quinone reductase